MIPRTVLTFAGCRTRAEAVARWRSYLEQHWDDCERQVMTDALANVDADDEADGAALDIDSLDAAITGWREQHMAASIDKAVAQLAALLDRLELGPEGP